MTGPQPTLDTGAGWPDWRWLTGFECSSFPAIGIDQLALTQHDRFWGSDLVRVAEAGCRTLRYGIRWHVVNPAPNVWDWSTLDGPMELIRHLGLEPIVDLFHFGAPTWLDGSYLSPIFPDFQAELALAFARRYPWVRWYTPTNEPYILAQFGGESGAWYPFERTTATFMRALRNVARGLCESWAAIREVRPDARLMISDTCEYWHAADERAEPRADLMNQRRFLMHELYGGRVGGEHPLRAWLVEQGFDAGDLEWFLANPAPLDVIGLDHYPHSEHELRSHADGRIEDVTRPLERQMGPGELARQYVARLGRPVIFAETGAPGDDATKIAWLDRLVAQIREARAAAIPVIGVTWWGLLDQVDWGTGLRRLRYEIDRTGLYRLDWRDELDRPAAAPDPPRMDAAGYRLARVETGALAAWRRYAGASPETTVGPLASSSTNAGIALW